MNWPLLLVLSVAAAVVVFAILRPAGVFVVRVRSGKASSGRGKVTDAFLLEVAEVFREFGIASGEVRGVTRGRRIALWFSSGVPAAARQRLRNWWVISGWPTGPRRA